MTIHYLAGLLVMSYAVTPLSLRAPLPQTCNIVKPSCYARFEDLGSEGVNNIYFMVPLFSELKSLLLMLGVDLMAKIHFRIRLFVVVFSFASSSVFAIGQEI